MLTQDKVNAAAAVIKKFTQTYGAAASDTMTANAVYSIASALGLGGSPSAEYADAVKDAVALTPAIKEHENGTVEVFPGNLLGMRAGHYVMVAEDEMDDLGNMDTDPSKDALPDEAALNRMTKAEIAEQATA
jgi:hypothetical protein